MAGHTSGNVDDLVSAEVFPLSGRATEAARALERLGLRVLHIGTTISVQGPVSAWTSAFDVSFEPRTKPGMAELDGGETSYLAATAERVPIPEELRGVVGRVIFAEPPEFFSMPQGD